MESSGKKMQIYKFLKDGHGNVADWRVSGAKILITSWVMI